MMFPLAAMHALAAQHGEGLRPQLVKLLESSKSTLEEDRASPGVMSLRPNLAGREPLRFATKARPK